MIIYTKSLLSLGVNRNSRTHNGDGDCIIKETILERDFRKNLHELNYKELFKRNLYVVEILSTTDNDYGTRTILVVREDKNYES